VHPISGDVDCRCEATAFFLVAGVTESMLVFEHSFDVRHAVFKDQRYSGNTAEVVDNFGPEVGS
jgi:hypothetical protein